MKKEEEEEKNHHPTSPNRQDTDVSKHLTDNHDHTVKLILTKQK